MASGIKTIAVAEEAIIIPAIIGGILSPLLFSYIATTIKGRSIAEYDKMTAVVWLVFCGVFRSF